MISDNKIIIEYSKKNGPKFTMSKDEQAILLKIHRKYSEENDVMKLHRFKGNNMRTDIISISFDFIKIRIAPFEAFSLDVEFKKHEGSYEFQAMKGSNLELLFYELGEKFMDVYSHSENGEMKYIIGSPAFSYVAVKKEPESFFIDLRISTPQLSYREGFQVPASKPLARQIISVNQSVKLMQEHFPDTESRKKLMSARDKKLDEIMHKHFNPKFG